MRQVFVSHIFQIMFKVFSLNWITSLLNVSSLGEFKKKEVKIRTALHKTYSFILILLNETPNSFPIIRLSRVW